MFLFLVRKEANFMMRFKIAMFAFVPIKNFIMKTFLVTIKALLLIKRAYTESTLERFKSKMVV